MILRFVLPTLVIWLILALGVTVSAQHLTTPLTSAETVERFYETYIALLRKVIPSDIAHDADRRTYKEFRSLLSEEFVLRLNILFDTSRPVDDPLICANIAPYQAIVNPLTVSRNTATMVVRLDFDEHLAKGSFLVDLRKEDVHWTIMDVRCEMPPEAQVCDLYEQFLREAQRDIQQGSERRRLVDWDEHWAYYFTDSLRRQLWESYVNSSAVDPLLCTNVFPTYFGIELLEINDSSAELLMRGNFLNDFDVYTTYDLVHISMEHHNNHWQVSEIRCIHPSAPGDDT